MSVYTFKKGTLEITENNTVIVRINDNEELDVRDVAGMFEKRVELIGEARYTVLLIHGKHSSVTAEARKMAAEPKHALYRAAFGMVVTSLAQRLIGNFYIKFDKPPSPTRLFTDEQKALEWVKTFSEVEVH